MLNKKAIAALAAGATLVSGLAFAAPSFAAEPQAPKKEECKPADAAKLAELTHAVVVAKREVSKKTDALADAQDDFNAKKEAYAAKKAVADKYNKALKDYKAAKDGDKKDDTTPNALKKLKDAFVAIANETVKYKEGDATPFATAKTDPDDAQAAELSAGPTPTNDNVKNAKHDLQDAKDALADAQEALAKAQCKTTPAPAPQPGPQPGPKNPVTLPTVVADPTTKDEAINATRLAAMVLQNAENDLAKKNHDYNDVKAAYEKVIRELSAAKANLEKAQHDLDAFLASGVDDSAKETRLTDLRDRAQAHVTRLAAEFTALTLKYNDAKTAAVNAGAAFKAAKAQYKKIYNEAIALGVNPALLPVVATSDPLMPNFADPAGAKELYAEAVSGKFGDAVAAAAKKGQKEAKKGEAKKGAAAPAGAKLDTKAAAAASAAPLSKTGVTVMFTALAASMLAGIGAAVRKFRH